MPFEHYKRPESKAKVSRENAEKVIGDYICLTLKLSDASIGELDAFIERLIGGAMSGKITTEQENGRSFIIHKLESPQQKEGEAKVEATTLRYSGKSGIAKQATRDYKANDTYGRAYALAGSLCGFDDNFIANLQDADVSIAEAVGYLFLV